MLADGFAKLDCSIKLYADDAKLYSSFQVGDYSPALVTALEYIINGPASDNYRLPIVNV